jgi:hypothetical protein
MLISLNVRYFLFLASPYLLNVASLSKTRNNESICEVGIQCFFLTVNEDGKTTA